MKTDTRDKANICNRQFQSAFTRETDGQLPSKGLSPFSSMEDKAVDPNGVQKLLSKLNIHKASGPDGLNASVHKECISEIVPVLRCDNEIVTMLSKGQIAILKMAAVGPYFLTDRNRCRVDISKH